MACNHKHPITIQDLYPELTPEQQEEAEYRRLKRFIRVLEGIYRRKNGLPSLPQDKE